MTTTIVQNSFLPTSIPGCKLWLDAADTSSASMTLSGTTLTTWKDKSGNGLNMTAGGNYPTYTKTGIQFNGGVPNVLSNSTGYSATTALTTFVVYQSTVAATRQRVFRTNYTGNSVFALTDTTSVDLSTKTTYNYVGPMSYSIDTANITSLVPYSATSLAYAINGTQSFSWSVSTSATPFGSIIMVLGGEATVYFTGYIMEVIMYDAYFTDTQRQQVEGYLAWKWGLQVNLPPTHPYKNSPAVFVAQSNILANLSITNRVNNAVFLPTTIPGCQLWLDAADRATQVLSGGNITQWNDKSGRNNNFTTTSGTITVGADGIYPNVVIFPNSMTYMTSASSVTFTTSSSVFIVAKITNVVSGAPAQMLFTGININGQDYSIRYNSSGLFGGGTSTTDIGTSSTYYTTGNAGVTGSLATYQAYHIVDTVFSAGGTSQFTLSSPFQGNRYWFGTVGEVLVYTSAITSAQRQQVEGYLAWKWRLQANLPSNHPYKNTSAVFVTQPSILAALGANPYNNSILSGYFNPRTIAGITLWLDGADTSSMTLSGTNITQWRDKSGQGFNQVGYNNPQYSSLTKGITLNGTTNYFASATSGGSLRIPTATHCLIAVHSPTTISGNGVGNTSLFRFQGVVGTAVTYIVFPYMNGTTPRGYINSQDGTTTQYDTGVLVENSVANTQNLIVANIASGSQQVYKNGSIQSSGTVFLSNTTSDFFALGCQNWTYINGQQYEFYSGTVYELMVFNTTITTVQRQQIEGYLAWKWGLQANLPSTHPFKKFPPPP